MHACITIALQEVFFEWWHIFKIFYFYECLARFGFGLLWEYCGNIHECIQNQCSAIALRHVFLERYDDTFLRPSDMSVDDNLLLSMTALSSFWFWFIVGVAEMRWPACPTLCIAAISKFMAQI